MRLDELFEAGIDSFKIDGVFQTPEYVVTVTKLYRQAIDAYFDDLKMHMKKLKMSYSKN